MHKLSSSLVAALVLVSLATPAFAETKTITGQLIDIGGYAEGRPASDYAGVHGRACALEGFEVGVLTPDGKVYHVTGDFTAHANAKLLQYFVAKSVTVTGDVSEKDGQTMIAASDVK